MKLSIISPTYNESENVGLLVAEIEKSLDGTDYEILISDDDSPDLTWARVEEIGRRNPRVRVLRRTSNRGLGPSVVDGFSAATGELVACIDADLQHDPKVLPRMLKEFSGGSTLVVATRYMPGGGTANWNAIRRLGSWGCTKLAQWTLGIELRDPMSGYFMMRRDDFMKIRDGLNARGFKILLEIAAHMQPCHLREVPYTFGPRAKGESKLTNKIIFAYLLQLWRLYIGDRRTTIESSGVMMGSNGEMSLRDLNSDIAATASEGQEQKGLAAYAAAGNSRK
jgi:dolichol-phosphate mannosyltransferase